MASYGIRLQILSTATADNSYKSNIMGIRRLKSCKQNEYDGACLNTLKKLRTFKRNHKANPVTGRGGP
jgi:hypothetical protein